MRVTDMVIKFITVRIDEKIKKIEKRKKQRDKRAARRPPPPPMAAPCAARRAGHAGSGRTSAARHRLRQLRGLPDAGASVAAAETKEW